MVAPVPRGSLVQIARTLPDDILGGMETHAWQLALAWRRRGWDVDVLTTSFTDRTYVEEKDGIRVHHLRHLPINRAEVPPWRWWRRFARRVTHYALAHRIQADAVHSESYHGHDLFRALRRRPDPPACVMTLHGTQLRDYRQSTRARLVAEVGRWHPRAIAQALYVRLRARQEAHRDFPSAHRIVVAQPDLRQHLIDDYHQDDRRVCIIPNGVEPPLTVPDRARLRSDLGLPPDARILLYVGRLDPGKRLERVIRHLHDHPHDRFLVAGSGPDEERLRALAADLPNPAAIRFLGPVTGVPKQRLYAAADVFVLPSELEGQPLTILEALTHGTPVYATQAWAPPDVAPLLAVGEDVTAGIDAALRLAPQVRAAAPTLTQAHSWDAIAQQYEDLFRRIHQGD